MTPHREALNDNFGVDYVITYRFANTCESSIVMVSIFLDVLILTAKADASKNLEDLVQALARVGFAIEVRNGEGCSLLVFVKVASHERLNNAVYRSRCAPRFLMS